MVKLSSDDPLSDHQYVFHFVSSTTDMLSAITECVYQALNKNGFARDIALDIWKAFDRIRHASFLRKLKGNGITGRISGLIHSFLTSSEMKVVLNGFASRFHTNLRVPPKLYSGPYAVTNRHQINDSKWYR